jgi:outer membrane protein assembly factor BamB
MLLFGLTRPRNQPSSIEARMTPGIGPGARRWLRWLLIVGVVLLVLAGGAVAFVLLHKPGNVSHPNLSFTTTTTTTSSTTAARRRKVVDTFLWPRYGFDAARTRVFDGRHVPKPPFRVGWRYQDYALLEFPPVIYHETLFFLDDNGSAKAVDKRTGHKLWERKIGTLAAASPGVGAREHLVYFPVLSTDRNAGQHPGDGRFVALSMRRGHVVWSIKIPPGTESSPIVYGRTLYFGDQGGTVRALDAGSGHTLWTYHASGAVKGGISYADGILYFGDYAGRAYALSARTGHQIWAVSTNGAKFGFGSGEFYSSPAVAFGRVYMGNTDGRVYSFAAKTGQLAWATGTGAYVYSSAHTMATSMRSTPAPARSAGHITPAGRSRGRRRSSATSSTSPISARRRAPGLTFGPAARCSRSLTARSIR